MEFSDESCNIKETDSLPLKAQKLNNQVLRFKKSEKKGVDNISFAFKTEPIYQICLGLGYIEKINFNDILITPPNSIQTYISVKEPGWAFCRNYEQRMSKISWDVAKLILGWLIGFGCGLVLWLVQYSIHPPCK